MKKVYLALIAAALLVSCGGNGKKLVGSWVQPIPGQENALQGMKLEKGGKAGSINMHTLVYEEWKTKGGQLILSGKSIGNGQTIEFTDTLKISKISAKELVLERGGYKVSYTKAE